MINFNLTPIKGMDTVNRDEQLQASMGEGGSNSHTFLRDIVNFDVHGTGEVSLRASGVKVSDNGYRNVWQSPLHKDVFATLNGNLVKVNTLDWTHEVLTPFGDYMRAVVVNNQIIFTGDRGLFVYNGSMVSKLGFDYVPAPTFTVGAGGNLPEGRVGVATTIVRGGVESQPSDIVFVDLDSDLCHPNGRGVLSDTNDGEGKITLTLQPNFDDSVTSIRVYTTSADGSDLRLYCEVAPDYTQVEITTLDNTTSPLKFKHMVNMPTGRFIDFWNGRLLVADKNVIRFSESMTYHIHDPRFGYIMMPQRITFMKCCEGGIWVGQSDHVLFIRGVDMATLSIEMKSSLRPVADSAIHLVSELVPEQSSGGSDTVVWLSENGFVLGTSNGSIVEVNGGRINNIGGSSASTVAVARRLISVLL